MANSIRHGAGPPSRRASGAGSGAPRRAGHGGGDAPDANAGEEAASSDRKLLWTLLILAGLVIGWTLAVDLEIDWIHFVGLAGALVVVVVIWFWPDRQEPEEPPI